MLSTLFDCDDVQEIINEGYENILLPVTKAIDKIMLCGKDGSSGNTRILIDDKV
ncbi:MAG TPA: hypothetical protein VJ799_03230 [Nitrososphaeraceae archaeon]|nr:hypothetical protein [Nitrososphaeraceae archaeon]